MIVVKHETAMNRSAERENHTISVVGHANFDLSGHDIVCAAVSALVQSFASTMNEWDDFDAGEVILDTECDLYDEYAHGCIDMLMEGLRMIEDVYPEYLTVSEELIEDGTSH